MSKDHENSGNTEISAAEANLEAVEAVAVMAEKDAAAVEVTVDVTDVAVDTVEAADTAARDAAVAVILEVAKEINEALEAAVQAQATSLGSGAQKAHHLEKEVQAKEALRLEIEVQVAEVEDTETEVAAVRDIAVQAVNDGVVEVMAEARGALEAVSEAAGHQDAAKAAVNDGVLAADQTSGAIIVAISSGDKTIVQTRVKPHPEFSGIYQAILEDGAKRLATKNFSPGRNVYGERLIRFEGVEYRVWDAFRSKLAGAILKGLKTVPILPGHKVLYLGAASGTTPSHISDIVGEEGHVYCVEFAQRSLRDLVTNVVAHRSNMSPFLADARMPQKYGMFIPEKLDDIYCDIAQPEQAKVLADNADVFLKKDGWVLLAIKSQSIDVTLPPSEVYQMEARVLRNRGFRVEQVVDLEPYDIAHAMIVAQR